MKSRISKIQDTTTSFSLSNVVANSFATKMTKNCIGYGMPGLGGGFGYIAVPKLSVGKISTSNLDEGTANIVSYDICEKRDAYIGQINMLTASSFCGLNGALWGYNLCTNFDTATVSPLFTYNPGTPSSSGQSSFDVYPIGYLLDAGTRLFGQMQLNATDDGENDYRRFPPLPGGMVTCANKSIVTEGNECYLWSALGVGIAEDRESSANLFIEDCGQQTTSTDMTSFLKSTCEYIAKSIVLCGLDQNTTYSKVFTGGKYIKVESDENGTALACVAYVQLPTDALPSDTTSHDLLTMPIETWESDLELKELPGLDNENSNGYGLDGIQKPQIN